MRKSFEGGRPSSRCCSPKRRLGVPAARGASRSCSECPALRSIEKHDRAALAVKPAAFALCEVPGRRAPLDLTATRGRKIPGRARGQRALNRRGEASEQSAVRRSRLHRRSGGCLALFHESQPTPTTAPMSRGSKALARAPRSDTASNSASTARNTAVVGYQWLKGWSRPAYPSRPSAPSGPYAEMLTTESRGRRPLRRKREHRQVNRENAPFSWNVTHTNRPACRLNTFSADK